MLKIAGEWTVYEQSSSSVYMGTGSSFNGNTQVTIFVVDSTTIIVFKDNLYRISKLTSNTGDTLFTFDTYINYSSTSDALTLDYSNYGINGHTADKWSTVSHIPAPDYTSNSITQRATGNYMLDGSLKTKTWNNKDTTYEVSTNQEIWSANDTLIVFDYPDLSSYYSTVYAVDQSNVDSVVFSVRPVYPDQIKRIIYHFGNKQLYYYDSSSEGIYNLHSS